MITLFQLPFMIWFQHTILSFVPASVIIFLARFIPWIVIVLLFIVIAFDFLTTLITRRFRKFRITFWEVVVTLGLALLLQWLLKMTLPESRPFLEGITPLYYYGWNDSFPSGHTIVFTALAVVVHERHRSVGIIFIVLALLIGLARIVVGIHWPLDIIAGLIIGLIIGKVVIAGIKKHYE